MSYHYHTLGLTPSASKEDVKAAFRRLCKKYHPDAAGGSHEKFVALREAYEYALKHCGEQGQKSWEQQERERLEREQWERWKQRERERREQRLREEREQERLERERREQEQREQEREREERWNFARGLIISLLFIGAGIVGICGRNIVISERNGDKCTVGAIVCLALATASFLMAASIISNSIIEYVAYRKARSGKRAQKK
ncbi:MAG: J domain-containing protein [Prevotellaceae bacterium]|jgi:hypothetical protein|nr:J domain-containing protein [Prevotellaceae bacterium]